MSPQLSQESPQTPDLTRESTPQPETGSLTALFQTERMRHNLSFADLSATTKYSAAQLKALEYKRWELLPKGFALRAMVRKYADALGVDSEVALELLARETGNSVPRSTYKGAMVSSLDYTMRPHQTTSESGGGMSWSTVFWLFLVLLVVVLGLALWQGVITLDDLNLGFVQRWFEAV